MKCVLKNTGEELAQEVESANTFFSRLCGLMFRRSYPAQKVLLLDPCPQIHTCFMRFEIDVIFLDKANRVLAVVSCMKPWRISRFYKGARRVLEFCGGSLQNRVRVGEEIIFK